MRGLASQFLFPRTQFARLFPKRYCWQCRRHSPLGETRQVLQAETRRELSPSQALRTRKYTRDPKIRKSCPTMGAYQTLFLIFHYGQKQEIKGGSRFVSYSQTASFLKSHHPQSSLAPHAPHASLPGET